METPSPRKPKKVATKPFVTNKPDPKDKSIKPLLQEKELNIFREDPMDTILPPESNIVNIRVD